MSCVSFCCRLLPTAIPPVALYLGDSFFEGTSLAGLFIVVAFVTAWALLWLMYKEIIGSRKSVREMKVRTNRNIAKSVRTMNKNIKSSGFAYLRNQNIFYTLKTSWQRKYGYCRIYDEAAAHVGMIIDCEPICFEYKNKYWMIEMWKGQYGVSTGAEVGIYNKNKEENRIEDSDTSFFKSVQNKEMLKMSFVLFKNGSPLFKRKARHWCLSGFRLGEFSNTDELSMRVNIMFTDLKMRDAFLQGIKKIGYKADEFSEMGRRVSIVFAIPHSRQPITKGRLTEKNVQEKNSTMCKSFNKITAKYNTMPQKMEALKLKDDKLYKESLKFGKYADFFDNFKCLEGD